MASFVTFSRYVLMERTIWYWYAELDTLVIGRWFGVASVGIYSIAKQIAIMLSERFAEVMNTVAAPAYSSVQSDISKVRDMYTKTLRLTSMATFPAFWGIAVVAPELVGLILGDRWLAAVPLVQLLCVSMPLRTIGGLAPTMLTAIGRPDVSFRCIVWSAGIVGSAIFAGKLWGVVGVAAAWGVAYPIAFGINARYIGHALQLDVGSYLRPLAKPLLCAATMVLVTMEIRALIASIESRRLSSLDPCQFQGRWYMRAQPGYSREQSRESS